MPEINFVFICVEATEADREVFVVANNKAEGSAPLTLQCLAERVLGELTARTRRRGDATGPPKKALKQSSD